MWNENTLGNVASTCHQTHLWQRAVEYYEELTGIPLLVNTSFNMHEEPIVCSPEDAIRAFLDSRLDCLAIGPFIAWVDEPDSGEAAV